MVGNGKGSMNSKAISLDIVIANNCDIFISGPKKATTLIFAH